MRKKAGRQAYFLAALRLEIALLVATTVPHARCVTVVPRLLSGEERTLAYSTLVAASKPPNGQAPKRLPGSEAIAAT